MTAFTVGPVKVTLTPADHAWQNSMPPREGQRRFSEADACGFRVETPDGVIWHPGDSRLMPEHLTMAAPDAILFDFSDNEWHFGLSGAVKLANAYPNTPLLLSHWGTVDAPDFTPFNGDPAKLAALVVNPDAHSRARTGRAFRPHAPTDAVRHSYRRRVTMNRRELLRSTTLAGGGLVLSRTTAAGAQAGGPALTSFGSGPTLLSNERTLGRGDAALSVSALSLGCMGMQSGRGRTPDEAMMEKLIQQAYDRGCTYFDTAEGYSNGRNEELLGRAIASFRNRVVVGTKFTVDLTQTHQRMTTARNG